jgi:hypothetical protein
METLGYALAAPHLHPLYQQCNIEREQFKHMVQFSEDKAWNIFTRVWKKSAALESTDPLSIIHMNHQNVKIFCYRDINCHAMPKHTSRIA